MKKRIILIFLAVVVLATFLVVPIGAIAEDEEIETQNYFETILDSPGCNLITMPYEFSQDSVFEYDGITITTYHNGHLSINGCYEDSEGIESELHIVLAYLTLKKGTYFLSGYFGEYDGNIYVSDYEGDEYWELEENGTLINITDKYLEVEIAIAIQCGEEFNNVNIYPMLNKGNTAANYQPYLPYLFGYNLGVSVGYSNGYAEGYKQGISSTDTDEVYNQGYEAGYNEAMQNVNYGSYAKGYEEGKAYGVNIGIKQGEQSQVTENFIGIIGDIAMTPYTAISQMFSFEIFGINVAGLIFQLITTMVVLLVVGLLFKYIF